MPSREVFVQGKAKWVHTKRPDQFGDYSMVLYPDAKSLDIIRSLIEEGIKNVLKKDDDGYFIKFKRPLEKEDSHGRKFSLGVVQVINKDNTIFDGFIGNGSDVTVKLETYGGKARGGIGTYKAARLAGIRVDTLIPYEPTQSNNPYVAKSAEGLSTQPPQVQGW